MGGMYGGETSPQEGEIVSLGAEQKTPLLTKVAVVGGGLVLAASFVYMVVSGNS